MDITDSDSCLTYTYGGGTTQIDSGGTWNAQAARGWQLTSSTHPAFTLITTTDKSATTPVTSMTTPATHFIPI